MTENEIYKLFQMDCHLTITFDTNALYGDTRFFDVCDKINLINDKLKDKEYKVILSSLVHAEKLFDLKQEKKEKYNINRIKKVLMRKKVSIAPFEDHHAEAVAELIGKQFPTNEQWRTFKRQDCINCLGINRRIKDDDIPGSGKECGATVDWLIAGQTYAENYLLITNDKGNEFKNIEKKTTLEILEKVMMKICKAHKIQVPNQKSKEKNTSPLPKLKST